MNYSEKLRDPRWQKKRLKILERDEFKCCLCGDDKTELQVHHLKYNGEPWEAKDEDLETLCKHCHAVKTDISSVYKDFTILECEKNVYDEKSDPSIICNVKLPLRDPITVIFAYDESQNRITSLQSFIKDSIALSIMSKLNKKL